MSDNNCKKSGLRQLVPEVYSLKKLSTRKSAAEWEADRVVNLTTTKRVQFHVCPSDAEIEATTCSIADTDCVVNQLESEIEGITLKDHMPFTMQFSICLVEFEGWWQGIGVQELRKTIEQRVIHFGYPKMHLLSHISESIRQMGPGDNFTTDISERLHIGNVKEAYRSTNKVNYIRQMLKHNDRSTSLQYLEETLLYLALQGWYDIDSEKVFNLLSAADKQRNTRRVHLLRLQHCQDKPFFRQVH